MSDYKEIIQLRNKGKSHEEIASIIGVSRRTIIRYLKTGKIPVYKRVQNKKCDLLDGFYQEIENSFKICPELKVSELFVTLKEKGYQGSRRHLERQTKKIRDLKKSNSVYFERKVEPGKVMEGDFTEMDVMIGTKIVRVYLWVTSLVYSNKVFATPFFNESFECFAQGSADAFNEFGGIADKYRLDNLKPAVKKILQGHDREVTKRYAEFQAHYGFKQDFCNPAAGWEKGNVESNNCHFKRRIKNKIKLNKLSFTCLEAFKNFVWQVCRDHNNFDSVQDRLKTEENLLSPLPRFPFASYQAHFSKVNKYSFFTFGKTGHVYSAPSEYCGMTLEVRSWTDKVELLYQDEVVASHNRIYPPHEPFSIQVEHIIKALCKKPGAFKDWKYRECLLSHPIWKKFYKKLSDTKPSDCANKDYLNCLRLMTKYHRHDVTAAMDLALGDQNIDLESKSLTKILEDESFDAFLIEPIAIDLTEYDQLLTATK